MRKVTEQKLRKLVGFIIFTIGMVGGLWIVRNSAIGTGLYAVFGPAFAGGFTALMWGNHKEHEHDSKTVQPATPTPPTQP